MVKTLNEVNSRIQRVINSYSLEDYPTQMFIKKVQGICTYEQCYEGYIIFTFTSEDDVKQWEEEYKRHEWNQFEPDI